MRILVTGGLGFIGSNFINLITNNDEVEIIVNLDLVTYAANFKNIPDRIIQTNRYDFYRGDINDVKLLKNIHERYNIDTIVHFAAESHVDRSIESGHEFVTTNINGTFSLLNTFLELWKGRTDVKFLHVSTDEVFGDLELKDNTFTKNHPYKPNSPYAASKASSDLLCRSFHKTHKFPVVITNCSNNFGPNQYTEKLIPLTIKKLKEGEQVPVYGSGNNIRDWIYVEDHCKCLWKVLKRGYVGDQYLIGGNNEIRNIDLVKKICLLCNKDPETSIKFVEDRKGHDFRYAINTDDFDCNFGKTEYTPFDKALKDTVTWYTEKL